MLTIRQEIVDLITNHPLDIRSISLILGISQKRIEENLEHIRLSYKDKFQVHPAICAKCDFEFTNQRYTKPGKCPQCRSTWVDSPRVEIVDL